MGRAGQGPVALAKRREIGRARSAARQAKPALATLPARPLAGFSPLQLGSFLLSLPLPLSSWLPPALPLLQVVDGTTVDDAVNIMQEAHMNGLALVAQCAQVGRGGGGREGVGRGPAWFWCLGSVQHWCCSAHRCGRGGHARGACVARPLAAGSASAS